MKIAIAILLCLIACTNAYAGDELTALAACMDLVKLKLNDPDSAQFDPFNPKTPRTIKQLSKGPITTQYKVRFQGRAKNGFGALMMGTFECLVLVNKKGDATAIVSEQIK